MHSVNGTTLESNKKIKINFDGGDLSSDAGLLLFKEFITKFGIDNVINQEFKTTDNAAPRTHTDDKNLLQAIYQTISAYFTDDCADELTNDPVFKTILDKKTMASQPTMSRFYNRMDENTMKQFDEINRKLRNIAYSYAKPKMALLDLDSTLLETYGMQEGGTFNYHYRADGYHPLVCYDALTGELMKIQLRGGEVYSSNGVEDFLQPLLDGFAGIYPDIELYLRGDRGFACPGLYKQCETNGVSYAIRLKENHVLRKMAIDLDDELHHMTKRNMIDCAAVYGEFHYRAESWDYPRRVVCKVEKPYGQLIYKHTFIVTNMALCPEKTIRYYCNRGRMENMIKESKLGFDFAACCSHSEIVNANRLQVRALSYNIFNWFRRLALAEQFKDNTVDTVRLKLIKVAARVVRSARYLIFKLCSSCPYKNAFYETLSNIRRLRPRYG